MLNFKNNRAVIGIEKIEEYPRNVSMQLRQHTLSTSEPNTIKPSELILGDGYAIRFVGFTRDAGIELIVIYAR